MIDDLVSKDLREPYRVLTSRSEYRSYCAATTPTVASPLGRELGLIDDRRWQLFEQKLTAMEQENSDWNSSA